MERANDAHGLPNPEPGGLYLIVAGLDVVDAAALEAPLELAVEALGIRWIELPDVGQAIDEVVRAREAGALAVLLLGSRTGEHRAVRAARLLGGGEGLAPVVHWSRVVAATTLASLLAAGCSDVVDGRRSSPDDLARALRIAFEAARRRAAELALTRLRAGDGLGGELEPEARRFAGTGRLLVSVAHDLGNLLQPLTGHLDLLAERLALDRDAADQIAVMQRSTRLAETLVRRLVQLGRTGGIARERVDPDRLLESLDPLLRAVAGPRVRLDVVLAAPGVRLQAPAGALEQIVLNLVTNARDAMPAGGRLALRTRRVGGWWTLEVSDTGVGIRPLDAAQVFDSGYTTKAPDRGAGLGLWIVRSLTRDAGGNVEIDSAPERGTTVSVRLPVATPV